MTGQNFDLKEEIRAYWSDRAATFDNSASHKIEDQFGRPSWQAFFRQAMGLSEIDDMDGLKVLDLACGTGEISRMLCSLGADVIGLDFSEAMHAIAKTKLQDQNWKPLLCDAENLTPLADDSFDFATTRHLAWTLTDPKAAYAEWFRVLKPGGRLLVNDGDLTQPFSRTHRAKRWIANLLSKETKRSADDQENDASIRGRLPYSNGLTALKLIEDITSQGLVYVSTLDVAPLYHQGMRAWPFTTRLRQSSENRFAIVFEKAIHD